MSRQSQIMDLLNHVLEAERAFVAGISEAERAEVGTETNWSAHDVVAHIAEWKERQARRIELSERGEDLPSTNDIDSANRMIFETHHQKEWDEINILLEHANEHLQRVVQSLPDEALDQTDRYPWQNGVPLWRRIVGNSVSHPVIHMSAYDQAHCRLERANLLQEETARLLLSVDTDPQWSGIVRYNLACHYALGGQNQAAIQGLQQALALNPGLREWSKEDPDLARLRHEPAFKAIYQTDREG
jgi:tetratricopeptide (TPR) repeat protein